MNHAVEVVEYTDPICSWAWGTEPKLRRMQWRHGHRLTWRVVLGGLIGDASQRRSDWDPVRAAEPMSEYWRRSSAYTGQPYPMPMHRMARSTDPAGRAVRAASLQGPAVAAAVLRRFRESTFVFGTAPETAAEFAEAGRGAVGLDVDRWLLDVADPASEVTYRSDWEETRRPNDHVRFLTGDQIGVGSMKHSKGHDRYAFPTLLFRGPGGEHTVPGWMPYDAYVNALEATSPGCTVDARPDPTAAEAFARWGVLTEQELAFLCGGRGEELAPDQVAAHFWGAGLVFFSNAEAVARRLPAVSPRHGQALADLAQSVAIADSMVARIPAAAWRNSTPCSDWTVRALVNHMVGSAHMVTFGLLGKNIGPEFYANHLGTDPKQSYREAIDEMIGVYRADPGLLAKPLQLPWGPMSGAELAVMFAGDHLIHAWDVARSVGSSTDFDHGVVRRLRVFADSYVAAHRGPEMFGPEAQAPTDACPMDRFAAFVGRHVLEHEEL